MSLEDKIASAKPTTFLTDGLSEEEVKQAVDEGRRRLSKVLDNKLISNVMEDDRCCICGGVRRFGICQDCGSDM